MSFILWKYYLQPHHRGLEFDVGGNGTYCEFSVGTK